MSFLKKAGYAGSIRKGRSMREFIGHTVKVAVEALGLVEGTLIDERQTMILVQGKDKRITRIIKAKICGFLPTDFEPMEFIPFHVLYCENKRMSCPGVQYVKEGEGFSRQDVEMFVSPCPCRCEDCKMGTKGELRSVSSQFLKGMISGTMFGEYPTKKEAKNGTAKRDGGGVGSGGNNGPDSKGKGTGGEPVTGKEPDHGGTGSTPEPIEGSGNQVQG